MTIALAPTVREGGGRWRREVNAVLTLAMRDFLKLLRDPTRMVSSLLFPLFFIGILGGSLQANLGAGLGFDFLTFTFTGVFAQTIFQSTSLGIISLIEDRERDFSQEIFVSPISRYSIVFGKILGEALVALPQGVAVLLFGLLVGVRFGPAQLAGLAATGVLAALFGGSFGIVILSNLSSQRAAQQVFPFIFLPQFFLAGIFNPVRVLPFYLDVLSRLSPMRYAVDLARGLFYTGDPSYEAVVLASPAYNLAVMGAAFALFMLVGTFLFVRSERNR